MSVLPLVTLNNISVIFNGKNVLDSISFDIFPSKIHTLIGPNGAGKSTLVKCILGLIKPSSGNIVRQETVRLGYVPQKLQLNESLPLDVHRFLTLNLKITDQKVDEVLTLVHAQHLRHSSMHTLSGGEIQRILLANAILKKPTLLVLDEPVQGVDVHGQLAMYSLISELKEKLNCAILMVSHDLHIVMAKTDEVICLHHHICCQGAPEHISNHPEYLSRFAHQTQDVLALYRHKHNHQHDLSGSTIKEDPSEAKNV